MKFQRCILFLVNGNYTHWTMWTACDKSCGNGTRTRSRSCSNPAPANGGKTCLDQGLGDDTEDEECFLVHCPGAFPLLLDSFFNVSIIALECGTNLIDI